MSIIINNTEVKDVVWNGVELDKVVWNGVTVFETVITPSYLNQFTIDSTATELNIKRV